MPFVVADGRGLARYHDVVRAPMLRLRRTTSPGLWAAGHARLADLFAARRAAAEEEIRGEPGRPWLHPVWQAPRLEELYHLLCAGPRAALPGALLDGVDACRADLPVTRGWARALADAGADADAPELAAWGADCLAALADEQRGCLGVLDLLLARGGLDVAGRVAAQNTRGLWLFRLDRMPDAVDAHTRALALDPRDPWAHHGLALVYRALRDFDAAHEHLDRADELAPGVEWVVRERGETYRRAGRFEEALRELDRAHALAPREPLTLGSRGQAKFSLGRHTEALADFDHALALRPDYTWALVRRAHARRHTGDTQGALADLARAEHLAPDAPGTRGERGDIHRLTGHHDMAIAEYDAALALDPAYAWAWGGRALSLEALGRIEEALSSLDEALRVDPAYDWARAQRARIAGREE
ncbi:tetratricopeptide repeat protein [Streptomyces sp. NPDC059002]|uniref:tetratricopeptide repeat protein n=1 Tax=Streptomyces sp. NPDC059002 TaxID=3346690 RepID=UPI00368FD45C